jgi:hypothetical protein
LRFGQVFDGICADVRDAPPVTFDAYFFLQTRQRNASIQLRQWAVYEPPNSGACDDHNNPKDPKNDPQNGSQTDPSTVTNLSLEEATNARNRTVFQPTDTSVIEDSV